MNGKTVYYQAWHYKSITKLIDLLNNQKRLLSFGTFTQKYEVKSNFINYYGLTHALGPLRTRINHSKMCDGSLTYSECFKVLSTFENDKDPGNDGPKSLISFFGQRLVICS